VRDIWLFALFLAGACDPARGARFQVTPDPRTPAADSVLRAEAGRIAHVFAQKYELKSLPSDDACPWGRYFSGDSAGGRSFGLNFCVVPAHGAVQFQIVEAITATWGPKGDALRRELRDTLVDHFNRRFAER
jgi:hypothetical protein